LQELLRDAQDPTPSSTTDSNYQAQKIHTIVAGADADDETARRRLDATSNLLKVAGTPRGQHLSAQTPRDVMHAEMALQEFIQAHGGGAEGLDALQQLMAAAAAGPSSANGTRAADARAQPAQPAATRSPPRDPPAINYAQPRPGRPDSASEPAVDRPPSAGGKTSSAHGTKSSSNGGTGGRQLNGSSGHSKPSSYDASLANGSGKAQPNGYAPNGRKPSSEDPYANRQRGSSGSAINSGSKDYGNSGSRSTDPSATAPSSNSKPAAARTSSPARPGVKKSTGTSAHRS
jgi:hypothetical protein